MNYFTNWVLPSSIRTAKNKELSRLYPVSVTSYANTMTEIKLDDGQGNVMFVRLDMVTAELLAKALMNRLELKKAL